MDDKDLGAIIDRWRGRPTAEFIGFPHHVMNEVNGIIVSLCQHHGLFVTHVLGPSSEQAPLSYCIHISRTWRKGRVSQSRTWEVEAKVICVGDDRCCLP